jgi:hypothetical protein
MITTINAELAEPAENTNEFSACSAVSALTVVRRFMIRTINAGLA